MKKVFADKHEQFCYNIGYNTALEDVLNKVDEIINDSFIEFCDKIKELKSSEVKG